MSDYSWWRGICKTLTGTFGTLAKIADPDQTLQNALHVKLDCTNMTSPPSHICKGLYNVVVALPGYAYICTIYLNKYYHWCATQERTIIWAVSSESVSSGISGQGRPWSDCASAQSDQGLCCPQNHWKLRLFPWRANARLRLCACSGWCESAHFSHVRRPFFAWRDPYCILINRRPRSAYTSTFCIVHWSIQREWRSWSDATCTHAYLGLWCWHALRLNI